MSDIASHEIAGTRVGHMPTNELVRVWASDFVHTDWRYVERYYETDRLPPWEECVVTARSRCGSRSDPSAGVSGSPRS
jgi:hypothetical protein